MAGEDLGGHRHQIVDHVNSDGGAGESEKKLQFSPSRREEALAEGQPSVGQYALQLSTGFRPSLRRQWWIGL